MSEDLAPRRARLRALDRWAATHTSVRTLAHALGSPLNVILGFATMLGEDASVSAEARAFADKIASQARKIRGLLDDAIEETSDDRAPAKETCTLSELLEGAAALAGTETRWELPEPTVTVRADPELALAAITAWLPWVAPEGAITAEERSFDTPPSRYVMAGRYLALEATLSEEATPQRHLLATTLRGLARAIDGYATIEEGEDTLRVELGFALASPG